MKMNEHNCKQNRPNDYKCAEIHNKWNEVVQSNQETKELRKNCSKNQQSTDVLVEKV